MRPLPTAGARPLLGLVLVLLGLLLPLAVAACASTTGFLYPSSASSSAPLSSAGAKRCVGLGRQNGDVQPICR